MASTAPAAQAFPTSPPRPGCGAANRRRSLETISVGINSTNDETRISQMMAFGRDGVLDSTQVRGYRGLCQIPLGAPRGREPRSRSAKAGQAVFAANCVACHGEDGKGKHDVGAPDLTDGHWIYGGDLPTIYSTVYSGRQGHMPHWGGRLSPLDLKILALYVLALGGGGDVRAMRHERRAMGRWTCLRLVARRGRDRPLARAQMCIWFMWLWPRSPTACRTRKRRRRRLKFRAAASAC